MKTVPLIVLASLVVVVVACNDSPPAAPSSQQAPSEIAPSPTPPVDQPTPATPIDVPFEATLDNQDLTRFRTLPGEFQNALREEATENGAKVAAQYFHDLPKDAVPIADLLDSFELDLFGRLDPPYRRMLLFEGHPNSTMTWYEDKWREGEITDIEYRFGAFEGMVNTRCGRK